MQCVVRLLRLFTFSFSCFVQFSSALFSSTFLFCFIDFYFFPVRFHLCSGHSHPMLEDADEQIHISYHSTIVVLLPFSAFPSLTDDSSQHTLSISPYFLCSLPPSTCTENLI